jgi:hypothetical protein
MASGRFWVIFMVIFDEGLPVGNSESPPGGFGVPDTVDW